MQLRQIHFENYLIPTSLVIFDENNKQKRKIKATIIPTLATIDLFVQYNYSVQQLKEVCIYYGLNMTGNKNKLQLRIIHFLILSKYCIQLQKIFRKHIVKKYILLHGPAIYNVSLCTNSTDFYTLDNLIDIPKHQFISICDDDGFIYGFQISSLYHLFQSNLNSNSNGNTKIVLNPYNRKPFDNCILKNILQLSKMGNDLLNIPIHLCDNDYLENNVIEFNTIKFKTLDLFQFINSLGNYSSLTWYLSLTRNQLIRFYKELVDIWKYRTNLSKETKRQIFPPHGNPFYHISCSLLYNESNVTNIQYQILKCMENMVYFGQSDEYKKLGALYILGALTIVSNEAAFALPWLYDSFRE